ncbi:MAG: glycerate kinase [Planctomycetota bacterium]|jgi:glycerate kinase
MKIVVAPNALKGSLSAVDAACAMRDGIESISEDIYVSMLPVADGGDGILNVLMDFFSGKTLSVKVDGPLSQPVSSCYGIIEDRKIAVVEMANASGLVLLKDNERDPLGASTIGTGQLIRAALGEDVDEIIVGIGGSATNDGGMGMACALGAVFYDKSGNVLIPSGINLQHVDRIDISKMDERLNDSAITVVCDVDNVLLGMNGATSVYGPQKGADSKALKILENGMSNFADVIQRDLSIDVTAIQGGGAAGGLGAGLCAFAGGELKKGVDVVLDLLEIDKTLEGADLVITAEGQIDNQTAYGKAPAGVAERAKRKGVPCAAISGGVSNDISELYEKGICAVFSLCRKPLSLEEAMADSFDLLKQTTEQAVRLFISGKSLR